MKNGTKVEIIVILMMILGLSVMGWILYVLGHFISKFW